MVLIALTEQDRHVQRGVLSEVEDERLVWRPVPLKAGRVVEVGGQGPEVKVSNALSACCRSAYPAPRPR